MANTQVDEGYYTRIENVFLERIISAPSLGSAEFACLLHIVRKTWGWGQREAEIAIKQFVLATGRPVGSVRHALNSLQKKRIIAQVAPPTFNQAAVWTLNKDWESWDFSDVGGVQNEHSSLKRALPIKKDTAQGIKKDTPPPLKKDTPPAQMNPERSQNQPAAPARKLQKERLKKKKEIKKQSADNKAVDARFVPLRDFFFEAFEKHRGYRYHPTGADFNGLKALVQETRGKPEYGLEKLQQAVLRFFGSTDPFYLKQGKPLAFFCGNVHAFMNGTAKTQKGATAPDRVGESSEEADVGRMRSKYAESIREKPEAKRTPDEIRFLEVFESGVMDD